MLVKRIYKANHGEGKTKWLVENAIDTWTTISTVIDPNEDNVKAFYLGSVDRYHNFCEMYEQIMHSRCPISRWVHGDMLECDAGIFFTDTLMDELDYIPSNIPNSGVWFITMAGEDFTS